MCPHLKEQTLKEPGFIGYLDGVELARSDVGPSECFRDMMNQVDRDGASPRKAEVFYFNGEAEQLTVRTEWFYPSDYVENNEGAIVQ